MRACQPVRDGYVERDGIKIFYEVFGAGEPTVLLLPTWSIIHSRQWKMQIPYLARHCRVITFDGRGNGRSDRPTEAEAYAEDEFATDAIAIMDATQTERAVIVGFSRGAQRGLLLAAHHPERVQGAVFIGSSYLGGGKAVPQRIEHEWEDELDTLRGLGEVQQALLAARLPRASSSSSSLRCSPSRIPRSRSKTASAGASKRLARRSR